MVKFITETLRTTIPFSANSTQVLQLPTRGYITRLELLLHLNVTTDATTGGTPAEDALARIIKSLRVEVPGGKPYFAVSDGRLLKYLNYFELGKVIEDALPTAAGVTADVYAKYYIILGFHPTEPFDPTCVIPAKKLNNLQLVLAWGNASNLGTGYTINSGEVKVTLRRIELEEDEKESDVWPEGINIPTFSSEILDITSVKSDLEFQTRLPVGNVIRDILILVEDSAGNRSDAEVSEVGIVEAKTESTPYRISWLGLVKVTAQDYGLESPVTGAAVLDLADVTGIPVGMDLSLASPGDWLLGFTTVKTGGKVYLLYRQYT